MSKDKDEQLYSEEEREVSGFCALVDAVLSAVLALPSQDKSSSVALANPCLALYKAATDAYMARERRRLYVRHI